MGISICIVRKKKWMIRMVQQAQWSIHLTYTPKHSKLMRVKVNEILPSIQGGKLIMQIPIRNKQTRIIRN